MTEDMATNIDCPNVDWLQIGGQTFAVRAVTFLIGEGWAMWTGQDGSEFAAPVAEIQVVGYQ